MKIGVTILGGTGYGAGEILRLLLQHPYAEVVSIISSSQVGVEVSNYHSFLKGFYPGLKFTESLELDSILEQFDKYFIFSALPHTTSAEKISEILKKFTSNKLSVIDLSADFRLTSLNLHQRFYGEAHGDLSLREKFVFGLTELYRDQIATAQHIANPGCLSSACILSAAPLIFEKKYPNLRFVFDAKTGTSGGGRTLQETFHHPYRHSNFSAYKILEHRHEAEIHQGLGDLEGNVLDITFVPHLLPVSRGIFASCYTQIPEETTLSDLVASYKKFYQKSKFVRIWDKSPELNNVIGTNFVDIALKLRGNQLVVNCCIDNLGKGMVGQAIQNMNVICGIDETTGLWFPSLGLF